MVSISRAAPAASNIWSVAFMISGPMPSPWATVIGVFVDIGEQPAYWNTLHRATRLCSLFLQEPSEAWRALRGHVEGPLECQAGASHGTLVEEAADERDAVRHAARRRESGERVGGIGRPIAARLRHLDEAGTEGQRGMAGEVTDGKHFVAQGRHQ